MTMRIVWAAAVVGLLGVTSVAAKGSDGAPRVDVSARRCASGWCLTTHRGVHHASSGHRGGDASPFLVGDNVAHATYIQSSNFTGWNLLNVTTRKDATDADQAYAAGFVEGAATWRDIINAASNANVEESPALESFLTNNKVWMDSMVAAHPGDAYWTQVNLTWAQFQGMIDGAQMAAGEAGSSVTSWQVFSQTLAGDFIDLLPALNTTFRKDWANMKPTEFRQWLASNTHCSAIVKLAADLSDIFFGHATWDNYNTMLRIYKHYFMPLQSAVVHQVSFSGYPGSIVSWDDFYVTDSGLTITETTMSVFNYSIYDGNVNPATVLYWIRATVANRLSKTAPEWLSRFGEYNSGTYNNQWIVLDMKLFQPGKDLVPNTVCIAEQMPGMYAPRDVTGVVQFGYWPSYNVPSNVTVFNYAGYPEGIAAQGGYMLDYEKCVRAQIFRRDQGNVSIMPNLQYLLRYNNYENDPISMNDPVYAIAARGDLVQPTPMCFGAIDAKVTSWNMHQTGRQVLAQSGPTQQQGIFAWDNLPASVLEGQLCAHQGAPASYGFLWEMMSPFENYN